MTRQSTLCVPMSKTSLRNNDKTEQVVRPYVKTSLWNNDKTEQVVCVSLCQKHLYGTMTRQSKLCVPMAMPRKFLHNNYSNICVSQCPESLCGSIIIICSLKKSQSACVASSSAVHYFFKTLCLLYKSSRKCLRPL